MIMLVTILFIVTTIFAVPSSSDKYFWAGDQKVSIELNRSIFVIVFKQGKYFKNIASTYENIPELVESIISGDQRIVALIFQSTQSKPESEILNQCGLTLEDIEWFSFGYTANGETNLKPTNRIAFKLKKGIDLSTLVRTIDGRAIIAYTHYGTPQIKITGLNVDLVSFANEIYESGIVEYCYPDFIANIVHDDDPLYPYQYFLDNFKKTDIGGVVDADIDAPEAWDITTGSSSIKVAVIDMGVEAHNDLKDGSGNTRIVGGYTPHTGGNGAPWYTGDYHGEACAGIIGASHNSINVRGVAPNVKILTVNIFAPNTTNDEVADGINWAWNEGGADVLSNSWGYNQSGFTWPSITNAINNARTNGRNYKGCVVVFAAGNTGSFIQFPANVTGVLCVSALSKFGTITDYSSRRNRIDIAAIGGDQDIRTLDRMGSAGKNSGDDMSDFDGTSAACPQVSGVAALILSLMPNFTEQQVKDMITNNAIDIGATGKDDLYGWGRLDAARSVAKTKILVNPQYQYSEGTGSMTRTNENVGLIFLTQPRPDIAAGTYIGDRYIVQTTVNGFAQTPLGWFTTSEGYSVDNPNLCVRWVNKITSSSSITLQTYFYYIKWSVPLYEQINKWAPYDPTRKYIALGIPSVPPVIDHFAQNPNPICKGGSGTVTAYLSQGSPVPSYTWTKLDGPASFIITNPNGNPCQVVYNNTDFLEPDEIGDALIRCTVTNSVGSDTKNFIVELVNSCPGCPTLAFDVGGEMTDDNPLLITSLSNPGVDVTDYYFLQNPVTPVGDKINLRIHEPQTEHTWLDNVELIEAKVKSDEMVAVTDEGEVINYKKSTPPVSVFLNDTTDISEILAEIDTSDIELEDGDILTLQRTTQSPENGDDEDLVLAGVDPIKNQESITIKFRQRDNSDELSLGGLLFRQNKSIVAKKLKNLPPGNLEIVINKKLTLDHLSLVSNLKTAKVNSLDLLSANHNISGDVKALLLDIDHNYAEILPGEIIDIEIQKGNTPAEKIAYIIKSVGRYETDTASTFNKLANIGGENLIPLENKLFDNYPNPFNPTTQIKYSVKENGMVTLKVYDVLGNEVAALVNEEKQAGTYSVSFNAGNLASGIYFYSISAGNFHQTKKMLLIK